MSRYLCLFAIPLVIGGCSDDDGTPTAPSGPSMSFFVTSATSMTGNLGGLCRSRCHVSATGRRGRARRAHVARLSERRADPANGNQPTHARDRIGAGPWHNANLVLVANNLAELHARTGDAAVFLDERGQRINGQWTGSPPRSSTTSSPGRTPTERCSPGPTCSDWTSDSATVSAQVGHSDGMGPNQSTRRRLSSWNSAHANLNCANTAPRGGAGRFYCFAR